MQMFLTRLGERSRAVVTGDTTQIDLHESEVSGLIHAQKILSRLKDVTFIHLSEKDVVRHTLVRAIVDAYDKSD